MRQFAVNNLAIPPLLNDDINRCDRCFRVMEHERDPLALCSHHRDALNRYAEEIGAPSPLQRGGIRINYTAHITEDAPELDMVRLRDRGQEKMKR